ncbi:hypothetical protein ACFL3C_05010 [Patescibacteria group bacterium]
MERTESVNLPQMCLRFASAEERPRVLEGVADVYRKEIGLSTRFEVFDPKHLIVLENIDEGDLMGAIALHDDPLDTAEYFGWDNLKRVEPKLDKGRTFEVCRQTVFDTYRHQGLIVSPILMFSTAIFSTALGKKWIIANQQPRLRDFMIRSMGIQVTSPDLQIVRRPKSYPNLTFWDKAVPIIVALQPSLLTQAWRFFFEHDLIGKLTVQDCQPSDPLLNPFFPSTQTSIRPTPASVPELQAVH